MTLGARIILYLLVLTLGSVLGLSSIFAHIFFGGWLTRLGLVPNACAAGCPEGWAVSLAGLFAITVAAGAGLFAATARPPWLAAVLAALCYGLALRWSIYGVQYALAAILFGLLAFWIGARAGAMLRRE